MRIAVYERGLDSEKFKFQVFVDPIGKRYAVGSTILQANRGFNVDENFAKDFFGLSKSGARASGDKWLEKSEFLRRSFVNGMKRHREDQIMQGWESFSYVGYPQPDFLRGALRVEPAFDLNIGGRNQFCHIYEMVFFCKRNVEKGDYYDAHLALRFFIGTIFDISDTTSRYGHEREQLVNPTNTIEINFHLNFVKDAGVAERDVLYEQLRDDMPSRAELEARYNLLLPLTQNVLSLAVYFQASYNFFVDAGKWYKFAKKESAKGEFKKRDIYRADSPERIVQYFQTEQTEKTRLVLCEGAGRVPPTMILHPNTSPCRFFSRPSGCRSGDQCWFVHEKQPSQVELRL